MSSTFRALGLRALVRSWRGWRRRYRARDELAALGSGAAGIAGDLNIGANELYELAGRPSGSADLLQQRMASTGLHGEVVRRHNPAVLIDLQRTCCACSLKSRCRRDLALPNRVARVADYCPNETTLRVLPRS